MKSIVIEDEGAARRRLEGIVKDHPELILAGSAASGASAVQLINSMDVDILLMDIQLKDMTAFEVLNKLDQDYSGKVVFITAYNNFAVKAFEVFAIDYVLKPYSKERVLQSIDRCLKRERKPKHEVYPILESIHFPGKLCIPEGKTSHLFKPDNIEWINADGYHSEIHMIDEKAKLIRILLKEIHRLLPDQFIRISRSVIINKNHVISIKDKSTQSEFILKSGKNFLGKMEYFGRK